MMHTLVNGMVFTGEVMASIFLMAVFFHLLGEGNKLVWALSLAGFFYTVGVLCHL